MEVNMDSKEFARWADNAFQEDISALQKSESKLEAVKSLLIAAGVETDSVSFDGFGNLNLEIIRSGIKGTISLYAEEGSVKSSIVEPTGRVNGEDAFKLHISGLTYAKEVMGIVKKNEGILNTLSEQVAGTISELLKSFAQDKDTKRTLYRALDEYTEIGMNRRQIEEFNRLLSVHSSMDQLAKFIEGEEISEEGATFNRAFTKAVQTYCKENKIAIPDYVNITVETDPCGVEVSVFLNDDPVQSTIYQCGFNIGATAKDIVCQDERIDYHYSHLENEDLEKVEGFRKVAEAVHNWALSRDNLVRTLEASGFDKQVKEYEDNMVLVTIKKLVKAYEVFQESGLSF